MKFLHTHIPEVLVIEPQVFGDERGFFLESWNRAGFAEAGLDADFVQDNHSRSRKGVLRGLHYQLAQPQGKLVRVTAGRVFDVAVDLRQSSPHLGQWVGMELSAENNRILWIPPGFAHGFLALEDRTDFTYKCTEYYDPTDEHCIAWNDPRIGIAWPIDGTDLIVSPKDRSGAQFECAKLYT